MCKRYGFPTRSKLYDHTLKRMLEKGSSKIMWDFSVQADHDPLDIIINKETK